MLRANISLVGSEHDDPLGMEVDLCLYVECKTFCIANKKNIPKAKICFKGFKRPTKKFCNQIL